MALAAPGLCRWCARPCKQSSTSSPQRGRAGCCAATVTSGGSACRPSWPRRWVGGHGRDHDPHHEHDGGRASRMLPAAAEAAVAAEALLHAVALSCCQGTQLQTNLHGRSGGHACWGGARVSTPLANCQCWSSGFCAAWRIGPAASAADCVALLRRAPAGLPPLHVRRGLCRPSAGGEARALRGGGEAGIMCVCVGVCVAGQGLVWVSRKLGGCCANQTSSSSTSCSNATLRAGPWPTLCAPPEW